MFVIALSPIVFLYLFLCIILYRDGRVAANFKESVFRPHKKKQFSLSSPPASEFSAASNFFNFLFARFHMKIKLMDLFLLLW